MIGYQVCAEETVQCLKDYGCDDRMTELFLAYGQESRTRDQIRLLSRQRQSLMNDLHETQKRVDCIDYIIRKLEQRELLKKKAGEVK